ncbi:hypothetical protein E3Q22_02170 [Wallemia mellicola]|uniref:CsbD-like domain-containing protein n=1 Tax=Wallemia mellicola TaxID=1708541 RepID=A0A4T0PLY3_9BASI|nr:hypothetical protein E3Q22_02170 [Wallemia mellicola]TIB97829.1 hypothetical protein E3Q18_02376 [Wallemia mellicola]TIC11930.1 hypothetical protein E3Q14_02028 [Wallemia mellicola]TIC14056.1 hypothetical protein E3Q15_01824 [Wallemia mellicola]TIC56887.1 hypothetical protein E3Q05_01544 [Wallemia mellicola]
MTNQIILTNLSTMSTDPSKTNAQYNSTVGSGKEFIGNTIGSQDLSKSGKEQHAQGEAERKEAEAKQYGEGLVDSATGKAKNIGGAITGDKDQQARGAAREQKGETKRDFA